ncbi:TANK-binding kinase 1-binding protein 1 [Gouania willdenowi]|uniref:UBZ1-type domain-containing protein n=1 Tax=Gouania willdenowi TaxID=441366 RepID=A0A8C5HPN2_GOUWI|nr:TANK-binding kinase 1-binding protein 1 [Gouania willdenowi]
MLRISASGNLNSHADGFMSSLILLRWKSSHTSGAARRRRRTEKDQHQHQHQDQQQHQQLNQDQRGDQHQDQIPEPGSASSGSAEQSLCFSPGFGRTKVDSAFYGCGGRGPGPGPAPAAVERVSAGPRGWTHIVCQLLLEGSYPHLTPHVPTRTDGTESTLLVMQSLFGGGELGLLGGGGGGGANAGGLKEDGCLSVAWRPSPLPPLPQDGVYSSSHVTLITAYQDIKTRLGLLERENSSIKRKLKIYEIKFPMISEFGEDTNSYCSFESKDTALLQSENGNLQQRVNVLTHELQKGKEREEQLEDVIQAYEKIHMEKNNVQRDLDKMTSLVEKHVERILNLESALRQRDCSLQKINMTLHSKDMQYLQLHTGPDTHTHMLDCPALTLQSSRSLDTLSDLKLQRLEAELEGARHEAQGACRREEELKATCERLKEEMRLLQSTQRDREMTSPCKQCDVEWIKKVGDEQVNLALAYTELTEELGRLQTLSAKQTEILRKATQEPVSPVQRHSPVHHQRHSPVPQRHSPISKRHSPVPPQQSPIQQRRSPVLQRLSPDIHRRSPLLDVVNGPASYSYRPPTQHLRASFQGRRSYSEVSDPSAYHCTPRFSLDPVSTLPKPRPFVEGYPKPHPQHLHRGSPTCLQGGAGGDGGLESSTRHSREMPFPLSDVAHLHLEPPPPSATAPPPPQSSEDEEEWTCPHPISPPRTLGVMSSGSTFPLPQRSNTLTCPPQRGYVSTEHAQSWPSINLWMESEESDMRSCPLCQLIFPIGYPDDALIKHIDSHLENSKI